MKGKRLFFMIDLVLVPATMVICLAALFNNSSLTCQYILK
jgi:hypothetical protein